MHDKAKAKGFGGCLISRRTMLGAVAGAAAATTLAGTRMDRASAATQAADQAIGARTPFVTIEAETGSLGGGAAIRSFTPGMPVPSVATLELEASGYAFVELKATGDSVTMVNDTGVTANTIVVRASIPDAPAGGGITATLDLYVDGAFRQAITLSSRQMWTYMNSTTTPDDPNGGGMPYHFYNEFPVWVAGSPIAPGSTITLRKGSANTASVYDIDCVDLENVPPPRPQPVNSLSVIAYGADPAFVNDSTIAIQNAVNDARTQGKSVWLPPGKYKTNSLAATPLDFTGVTVNGAGMWHSIIHRDVPLPPPVSPWRSYVLVGSGTTLTDVQIDSSGIWRGPGGAGGDDYGILAEGAGGWLIDRVWTRHCNANWLSGSNATVQNSRTGDSWADGFNLNNSNHPSPDLLGDNLTVRNCFARGTGDDAFATFSDSGASGTNGQMTGATIVNNTAVAPWWANGIRVAGGQNVHVHNNLVHSVSSNGAMTIGVFGNTGHPLESCTVSGNVLFGGGGWNGIQHGVHIGSPASTSFFPAAYTNVRVINNVLRGALRAGLVIDKIYENVTLLNNLVDHPAEQGIWITSGVTGTGELTQNTVRNLLPGQVPYENDSPATFTTALTRNSWQGT